MSRVPWTHSLASTELAVVRRGQTTRDAMLCASSRRLSFSPSADRWAMTSAPPCPNTAFLALNPAIAGVSALPGGWKPTRQGWRPQWSLRRVMPPPWKSSRSNFLNSSPGTPDLNTETPHRAKKPCLHGFSITPFAASCFPRYLQTNGQHWVGHEIASRTPPLATGTET